MTGIPAPPPQAKYPPCIKCLQGPDAFIKCHYVQTMIHCRSEGIDQTLLFIFKARKIHLQVEIIIITSSGPWSFLANLCKRSIQIPKAVRNFQWSKVVCFGFINE